MTSIHGNHPSEMSENSSEINFPPETFEKKDVGATQTTTGIGATSDTLDSEEAVIQNLESRIQAIRAQVDDAINNISRLDPAKAGAEDGIPPGNINEVLLAQFPYIALAMMELGSVLMKLGFGMSQFTIKYTQLTADLGKEAARLQKALTKAQILETQGELVQQSIGLGAGVTQLGHTAVQKRNVDAKFKAEDTPLANQQATAKSNIDDLKALKAGTPLPSQTNTLTASKTDPEIGGISNRMKDLDTKIAAKDAEIAKDPTNQALKTEKADLEAQKAGELKKVNDKLNHYSKEDKDLQTQRDDLKKAYDNESSLIPQRSMVYGQMMSHIGGIVAASLKIAAQTATIEPASLLKNLEMAATAITQNALSSSQASAQAAQAAFDSLLQQYTTWVNTRGSALTYRTN
jgi:hypothetical protein